MNLIQIPDDAADIHAIWALANQLPAAVRGNVAWSFEGNGIRTRTSFIMAFRELGLSYIELPNLLKTSERVADLAAYLDSFYQLYVVRESNHQRLQEFAQASCRPVINAMSNAGHPCEVLTDAFYINTVMGRIEGKRIGLWGPTTNVFRSWHQLAATLGFAIYHFCPPEFHTPTQQVSFSSTPDIAVDILITDSWPVSFEDGSWSLTRAHLDRMGNPQLLPTPPFYIGKEVSFDPVEYPNFTGYRQKQLLLPVQRAIMTYLLA